MYRLLSIVFFMLSLTINVLSQNLHVKLVSTKLSKEQLDFLQRGFNYQLSFYEDVFGSRINEKVYATVFDTKRQYDSVAKLHKTRHTAGFFDGDGKRLYLFKQPEFNSIFQHELSHGLLDQYCTGDSGWFNEGIAEYNETIFFDTTEYRMVIPQYVVSNVRYLLGQNFNIFNFVSLSYTDWKKLDVSTRYNMAWAVVFYLLSTDMERFKSILHTLCTHSDLYRAIDYNYPGGFELFVGDLRSFFINSPLE